MEYGPRALGNRSILADPGHPEMRDRINAMVKKREAFRPFAPACSVEEAHRWFEVAPGAEFPYMISIVDVRPEMRAQLPAITHVNGSARLQTVQRTDNPDFHALLEAVGKTTGRQMVLNTSFNVKGPAHRQHAGGSHRNLPRHRHRVSVPGELPCYPRSCLSGIETEADYPRASTIADLFAAQAARTPDAVAVIAATAELTYRQLDEALPIAWRAICRTSALSPTRWSASPWDARKLLVVSLLAILKAGGAYVPLDPTYPQDRLSLVIEDSQMPVLLTTAESRAHLPLELQPVSLFSTSKTLAIARAERGAVASVGAPAQSRLRDLHLRLHGQAEGRDGREPQRGEFLYRHGSRHRLRARRLAGRHQRVV